MSQRVAIEPVREWLMEQSLLAPPLEQLIPRLADRARAAGLPVDRLHMATNLLHPQFRSISFTWRARQSLVAEAHRPDASSAQNWMLSPFKPMIDEAERQLRAINDPQARREATVPPLRLHLERGEGLGRYPVLDEIVAEGGTDYVACIIAFGTDGTINPDDIYGVAVSWSTFRPGGFTDADLAAIGSLRVPLAAAVRSGLDIAVSRAILSAYLGADAGARVLAGDIFRGQVQTLRAAILYGDLRGFTAVTDRLPGAEVVTLLDRLFEAMAGPVLARGGQVMKFMGDAILATFAPGATGEGADEAAACTAALDAAVEAQAAVAAVNAGHRADGKPEMPLDQALHLGTLMYGNVGTEQRLDFTVIGPAINEASRMEALCQPLDVPITISRSFADATGDPGRFRSLGEQTLRGLSAPREIFTVA